MKFTISTIVAVAAALIVAPAAGAEPCGNPDCYPNSPTKAQDLAVTRATGIAGAAYGLISAPFAGLSSYAGYTPVRDARQLRLIHDTQGVEGQ